MSTVLDTSGSSLPTRVDLPTWDDVVCLREDAYELVEGVPTMAPSEEFVNRAAGALLAGKINAYRRPGGWLAVEEMDVTVQEVPRPTIRRPDVVVVRMESGRRLAASQPARRVLASEVALIVEVVSPSSVERDLAAKRGEYARAGIPAYLVVDLRAAPGRLTLCDRREDDGLFVDGEPRDRVVVTVDGTEIPLDVTDLLP